MIELALLAIAFVAGAVFLFAVSIRVGMLLGTRLDRFLQARYEAGEAERAAELAAETVTAGAAPEPPAADPRLAGRPGAEAPVEESTVR